MIRQSGEQYEGIDAALAAWAAHFGVLVEIVERVTLGGKRATGLPSIEIVHRSGVRVGFSSRRDALAAFEVAGALDIASDAPREPVTIEQRRVIGPPQPRRISTVEEPRTLDADVVAAALDHANGYALIDERTDEPDAQALEPLEQPSAPRAKAPRARRSFGTTSSEIGRAKHAAKQAALGEQLEMAAAPAADALRAPAEDRTASAPDGASRFARRTADRQHGNARAQGGQPPRSAEQKEPIVSSSSILGRI